MPGALSGIRVADFSSFAVGPWAGALLGAMGADVIKVENPRGDPLRAVMPTKHGYPTTSTTVNLNKRSVILDLKDPEQNRLALTLAAQADVLIENYRAGVMSRLGLGYETVRARNPAIVYCSSSSFGPRGPMAKVGSTDAQGQAFGGGASLNGAPGVRAEISRHHAYLDLTTSFSVVQAILAALYHRLRTGRGQHIQTSQMHAAIALQTSRLGHYFATGRAPRPMGSAVPHIVPSQAFRARDGRWINVSVVTPEQWRGLCRALRRPDLACDPRFVTNAARVEHRSELVAILEQEFARAEGSWWLGTLEAAGVPCGAYLEYEDLVHHEHFRANRVLREVPLPDGAPLLTSTLPWRFDTLETWMGPAPQPGEHTEAIVEALRDGTWPGLDREAARVG
jgi:crotonobetainyl-CoA:carnitine CoA-transferase CaiB-like acyl-CoA transferase